MKFETHLIETIPRTSDVMSFRFPRPAELNYKPGQYMLVTIKVGEKEQMHPLSFSSSPTEKDNIEFTKKFTSSDFSTALKALKLGDLAKIDAPYGNFTFTGEHAKICLLSGGIGITPFRSICKYCTDLNVKSDIVLLYGCRTENDVAFKEELEAMQLKTSNIKMVVVLNEASPNWGGHRGFITAELVKQEVPDCKERVFYACGPPIMVQLMGKVIIELDLPIEQLKVESLAGHA